MKKIYLVTSAILLFLIDNSPVFSRLSVVIPPSFPEYVVENYENAAPGYIYLNLQLQISRNAYNVIMDNEGNILYFRKVDAIDFFEFKPFPALEVMATFRHSSRSWEIFDLNYEIVEVLDTPAGYVGDAHELLLLEDGHAWLIRQHHVEMDLSELVEGGNEEAIVIEMALHELDENRELIYEWNSLEHIGVMETDTVAMDVRGHWVDYMHTNSIDIDDNGDILISSKYLNEITKIDYESGDIIWRMGGGSGNQFTFINDNLTTGFNQQHHARWMDNGNLLLFDNGFRHPNRFASAKEYEIDEENHTATLVWSYFQDPPSHSYAMGGAHRLENGNTMICWGYAHENEPIIVSEVASEGDLAWQITFPVTEEIHTTCYRAYKSNMIGSGARPYAVEETTGEGNILYMNHFGRDNIDAYVVSIYDENENEIHSETTDTNIYYIQNLLPGETYFARIRSIDSELVISEYSDAVRFEFSEFSKIDNKSASKPENFSIISSWPNPFNSSVRLNVDLSIAENSSLTIYDIAGRQVEKLHLDKNSPSLIWVPGENIASGVYFVRLMADNNSAPVRKLLFIR